MMKMKLLLAVAALVAAQTVTSLVLNTTCGIVDKKGELIRFNGKPVLYEHNRKLGDLSCACDNKDIPADVARFCRSNSGADSATVLVCTITDKNRLPVWAHFEPGAHGTLGHYVEHTGPAKVDSKTGKIVDANYAQLLTYVVPGASCSVSADAKRMPIQMLKFAQQNNYNSSNPATLEAAVRKIQGEMALNAVTSSLRAYVDAAARAVGDKLQPLGDKANAQIERVTNSAAGQKVSSALDAATRRVDAVNQSLTAAARRSGL